MLWIFTLSTAKQGTETNSIGVVLVVLVTEQFLLASCVLPIVHILDNLCFLGLGYSRLFKYRSWESVPVDGMEDYGRPASLLQNISLDFRCSESTYNSLVG